VITGTRDQRIRTCGKEERPRVWDSRSFKLCTNSRCERLDNDASEEARSEFGLRIDRRRSLTARASEPETESVRAETKDLESELRG